MSFPGRSRLLALGPLVPDQQRWRRHQGDRDTATHPIVTREHYRRSDSNKDGDRLSVGHSTRPRPV